jgi:hypothetical protein
MFGWCRREARDTSSTIPLKESAGTLNSTLPPRPSGEVHPSSAELPKTNRKRNQRSVILGATEVTTEPTTASANDCPSVEASVERFELHWVLPKPMPGTYALDQDVVRVWSVHAPPERRQRTAREHAIQLLRALELQPRLAGKWILATDLEKTVYPNLLAHLGWAPRPWVGRNGVAKHLGKFTLRRYKRVEVEGSTRNWAAFLVPPAGRETCGHASLRPTSRAKGPAALFISTRSDLRDV